MNKQNILTHKFVLLFFSTLCCSICSYILSSTMPLFLQLSGKSTVLAGLSTTAVTMGCLFMRPSAGKAVDRTGRKIPLLGGSATWAIAAIIFCFLPSVGFMLIIRFISGLFYAFYTTAAGAAATDYIPKERLLEGIGLFSISSTISAAIGPAIGNTVADRLPFPAPFVFAAVFASIGFVLALLLLSIIKQPTPSNIAKTATPQNNTVELVPKTHKTMVFFLIASLFFVLTAQAGVMTFLASYSKSKGLGGAGSFFTVFAVSIILARLFLNPIKLTVGTNATVYCGLFCFLGAFIGILSATNSFILHTAALLLGLGVGIIQPIINTLVVEILGFTRRGTASTLNYAAIDLGLGLGALLWGAVARFWSFQAIYIFSMLLIAVSIILFFCFVRLQKSSLAATLQS